jgi:hypothetical protein
LLMRSMRMSSSGMGLFRATRRNHRVIASEAKQSIRRAPPYEWIASSLRSSQ